MPTWRSTVAILLFAPGFRSLLVMIFSTAKTTPPLHRMPIAVPPFSTALTAYSTYRGKLFRFLARELRDDGGRECC